MKEIDIVECRRIFRKVKHTVKRIAGIERPSLTLAIQKLPPHIEAYHPVGTHYVVINRDLLSRIFSMTDSRETIESYLFPLLLHEYLHSFGFDENYTYHLTIEICSRVFGEDSLATHIAKYGVSSVIGRVESEENGRRSSVEVIGDLDLDNQSYIA
ncbi:MAG: hypothetical protein QW374_00485 [Candidatus Bathyarchaeia archaeon]|nr:hypothetical protein [Candidatus Bathyarchaeota archaeon]